MRTSSPVVASASSSSDDERRALTTDAQPPPPPAARGSVYQRAYDLLRNPLNLEPRTAESDREADGAFHTFTQELRRPFSAGSVVRGAALTSNPISATGAIAPTSAGGAPDAAPPALPDGVPRGDIQAAARWVEDAMPFAVLLLCVFLYRHLLSILIFFWLTSLLHNANERMRTQTLLKSNRSRRALFSLAALLIAQISCISLFQGSTLPLQLSLRRVDDFAATAGPLSTLLWDIILTDICARALLLLAKTLVAFAAPPSAARRLRRVYSAIEAAGLCYRLLLPTPLWFHWLFHASEDTSLGAATLWSVGISHLYLGLKLVALVDRTRRAATAARAVLFFHLPVGKYASAEEVMELGEDGCSICQEEHTTPVKLECGHVYCEECITAWCERTPGGATCPLCRAPIQTLLGMHSDGTTTLLPQLF